MSSPRADFTATLLQNGHVLLAGGQDSPTSSTAAADIFDPVTMSITPAAPMKIARSGHTATLLLDGRVLVVGGHSTPDGTGLASGEIYDPTANSWSLALPKCVTCGVLHPHVHHAAVLLADGGVMVSGGSAGFEMPVAYYPDRHDWIQVGVRVLPFISWPRPYGSTATRFSNGVAAIHGGGNGLPDPRANTEVELYVSATDQLTYGDTRLQDGRNWATATLLGNGTMIVAGGQLTTSPAGALSTTDLYDPAPSYCYAPTCGAWSTGPSMNVGHCHHTATLLKKGLLLVAGGRCGTGDSIAVSELYDPVGKKWWPAGPLQDARGYHAAALLNDGRVIVAGGFSPGGTISNNVEIYTPA